jgi:methionine-rich copper-binding protein CopC
MDIALRLALAAFATAISPLASANASLVDSFPARGQTLAGSPAEIHLSFNGAVDARRCRIKLASDAGKHFDADRPSADKTRPNTIVASVPVLKPGTYSARWTAIGSDGHKSHGDFSFTVAK